MAEKLNQKKLQAAWDKIEALGGYGVWEPEMVIISFAKTGVQDADLVVFQDFPLVQTLNLSDTSLTAACLPHLSGIASLEELILVNTRISATAIQEFQRNHPHVNVVTEPLPPDTLDPFTGKPFGSL